MLQEEFMSVLKVKTRDELLSEVVSFTKWLGFEIVNAMVVVDHSHGRTEFIHADNTPAAYREVFVSHDSGRNDPVMQHCKCASAPIVWNQDTYASVGLGDRWETQARFGYHTGIALAQHLPKGLHFFIGVDRDQPLPASRSEVSRMVAGLHLFAAHAQEAALRVLLPSRVHETDIPDMTARELECLRWTMEGKTAWEVGCILGISEQTAVRHLNNATHKLDCVNKHHAMVKALRLGLIQ